MDDPEHSGFPLSYDENGDLVPMRFGHEYAGTVSEVGSDVTTTKVGDRVTAISIAYCGKCAACTSGAPLMSCTNKGSNVGGVGEAVVVSEHHVYVLPERVDLRQGALVEPMAVCWHAIELGAPTPDDAVVIAGAGPIGIGVYLGLRAKGIHKVLVSEPNPDRRRLVESLGAQTIDPTTDDMAGVVQSMSDGRGASVFFDAAGAGSVFTSGLDVLGAYGRFVVIAISGHPVELHLLDLQFLEKRIIGALGYMPADYASVIAAMDEGGFPIDGWVQVRPAADVREVIADLKVGRGAKILLKN
jgi:(R,R)-butanediol dehydrogenase/meso-butanediol dehydrogenase/diacetyl reductase